MARNTHPRDTLDAATDVAVVIISSFISKSVVAPLTRVTALLQSNYEIVRQGRMERPYSGAIDCFVRIKDQEGILSFWRGNSIHLTRSIVSTSFQFVVRDKYSSMLKNYFQSNGAIKPVIANIMAGSLAGATSLLITYPFQLGYTKRAVDVLAPETGMTRQYKGVTDIWKKVVEVDGIRGLYRGLGIALGGAILHRGIYFGLYDSTKGLVKTRDSMAAAFALGSGVTLIAGAATYPIGLLQQRLMVTTGLGLKYNSAWHASKEIFKKEGARGFYRGYAFTLVQALGGGALLAGYDIIRGILNE